MSWLLFEGFDSEIDLNFLVFIGRADCRPPLSLLVPKAVVKLTGVALCVSFYPAVEFTFDGRLCTPRGRRLDCTMDEIVCAAFGLLFALIALLGYATMVLTLRIK